MIQEPGIDLPEAMPEERLRRPVRHRDRLGRHLRRHRRRDGGGPADGHRAGDRQKVESLFDHADIIPVRGFEGVRYAELPIPARSARCPRSSAPGADWDWLKGADAQGGGGHGTANAKKVMEDIKAGGKFSECHFIEFMACPGGCLGGGGQPIPTTPGDPRGARQGDLRRGRGLRGPQVAREPGVSEALQEFLTDGPCGTRATSCCTPTTREVHHLSRGRTTPYPLRRSPRGGLRREAEVLDLATRDVCPCDRLGVAFLEESGRRVVARRAVADYEPVLLGAGWAEDLSATSLGPVLASESPRILDDLPGRSSRPSTSCSRSSTSGAASSSATSLPARSRRRSTRS
jgi:hypothetical protein